MVHQFWIDTETSEFVLLTRRHESGVKCFVLSVASRSQDVLSTNATGAVTERADGLLGPLYCAVAFADIDKPLFGPAGVKFGWYEG